MSRHLRIITFSIAILLLILPTSVGAVSSTNFYQQHNEIFDDWDLCRTCATGEDGFFQVCSETEFCPLIIGESLAENADRAYQLGQRFITDYPDTLQRAERIFAFARDRVRYTSDADQFGFREFAQNADELASTIEDKGFAYGDCEDYAILLTVMYKGADLRSAIVLAPEHAAALVYLPEYNQANQILSIDGESGWVWAEATGGNNPLGWMPERFIGAKLLAYEVEDESITRVEPSGKTHVIITQGSPSTPVHISPFFSVIAVMWLLALFRRRR